VTGHDAEPGPTARQERKFVAAGWPPAVLTALLAGHPARFRRHHPPRWVNSLYYDTPRLDAYRATVEGATQRSKLRLRWYGPLLPSGSETALELKTKVGLIGYKRRRPVEGFCAGGDRPGWRLADLPGPAPTRALRWRGWRPVVVVRYRRAYLLSADGRFRVTIDTDLVYHRPSALQGRAGRGWAVRHGPVVELKYALDADADAPGVAAALPLRLSRSSKYAGGIARLYAGHPEVEPPA